MEKLSFDKLPEIVNQLVEEVQLLKRLIIEQGKLSKPDAIIWFDMTELCNYLPDKPAKATVYTWIHEAQIPYYKGGKKLRFLKSDIDTWIQQGRRKTMKEINEEVDNFLNLKKR